MHITHYFYSDNVYAQKRQFVTKWTIKEVLGIELTMGGEKDFGLGLLGQFSYYASTLILFGFDQHGASDRAGPLQHPGQTKHTGFRQSRDLRGQNKSFAVISNRKPGPEHASGHYSGLPGRYETIPTPPRWKIFFQNQLFPGALLSLCIVPY